LFIIIFKCGTELENMGVRALVKTVGSIKGFVKRTSDRIKVNIPPITKLARLIVDVLCNPRYVQLAFDISS
jgi:hypothetical protein